jgi:hypothetical protein
VARHEQPLLTWRRFSDVHGLARASRLCRIGALRQPRKGLNNVTSEDECAGEGRSGWVEQFLRAGDALRAGGRVASGEVGVRLAGGIELTGRPAGLAGLGRELFERFSRRAMAAGVADPQVLIVGDLVDGFRFFGPAPGADTADSYHAARTARLDAEGEPWCLAELRPMSDLRPVDGDDRPPVPAQSAADVLAERADALGLGDGDLDDVVHEVASRASTVNNSGRTGRTDAGTAVDALYEHLVAAPAD